MYFNSIFENQAINNKGAALPDKYRDHVDANGNRLAAFTQNLTALTGQKDASSGTMQALLPKFNDLDARNKRDALIQAYRKEKMINRMGQMKGKDTHIYNAVQASIANLTDPDLKKQLSNVFQGYAASVNNFYGEKAKDITITSLINGYSSEIRQERIKRQQEERMARLKATQFFNLR